MERDELCGRSLGEFVLRERLGEGGFGAVYRCEQPLLGRQAVIKVLHRRLRTSETAMQRFLREARLASRLDHPYAAHIYAFGVEKDDGLTWIAMEMVHGTPLDQFLAKHGPLPLAQLVPFFERIAEVVHTAHEQNIVHRDLKPQNVMVIERAGRLLPKLLDFGVAKLMEDYADSDPSLSGDTVVAMSDDTILAPEASGNPRASEVDTLPPEDDPHDSAPLARITQAGSAVGSPPYMAPELWTDASTAGPPADLYALGILTYEALVGRLPFLATSSVAFFSLHMHAPVPPVGEPHGTPALDRFFARALAKRPEERHESALALAAAFRVAAGLAEESVAIPKLDESVRDIWLQDGPQPIAEAVAALDAARNAHQARDTAWDLMRVLMRYLVALALAARAQVRSDRDDRELGDLLRTLRQRELSDDERVTLLRLLVRPFRDRRGAYPIPQLVDLVNYPETVVDPITRVMSTRVSSDAAGASDDLVRSHLAQLLPAIAFLLRAAAFVLDYTLIVPRDGVLERWMGLRRPHRPSGTVRDHRAVDRQTLLVDAEGKASLLLWPLVRIAAPSEGTAEEIFIFDGRGRHGARMIASPAGFEMNDGSVWDWLADTVIGTDTEAAVQAEAEAAPYLGLAAFSVADADRFVGREREIDAFINRLRTTTLQVVVGASGAGKSSFVFAGVVPNLPADWHYIALRPGTTPVATLTAKLAFAKASGTLVLIIDQLEEVFTLCQDEAERERFAKIVAQVLSSTERPARVVCTVRDDFLMRVEPLEFLRARLSSSLVLLGNPSRDELVRIVVEPAKRAGYVLSEPELAQQMVDEVADRPGALALLSFTGARLWELRDRRFRQLTRSAYDAMGGVAGALGKHADDTFTSLAGDDQRLARELFRHLVTSDGTRAVLTLAELRQLLNSERASTIIDALVAARLVVVGDVEGEPRVEIIHEALISAWPRLQAWIREDSEGSRMRDQLRAIARQWHDSGRPNGLLWRDEVLADLERWLRRSAVALTDNESDFSNASRREASRARRVRRTLLALAFAVLGVGVLALLTLNAEAHRQRENAAKREKDAKTSERAAQQLLAEQYAEHGRAALVGNNAGGALVYLLAAIERGLPHDPVVDFMLGEAARKLSLQREVLADHTGAVKSAELSPDGTRLLTASDDGTARIWDVATRKAISTLSIGETKAVSAQFDHAGKQIVVTGLDGGARVFSSQGTLVYTLTTNISGQTTPSFSFDGTLIATGGQHRAKIWNAATGELVREITTELETVDRTYFTRNGELVIISRLGGRPEVYDPKTSVRRAQLVGFEGGTGAVAWSADRKRMAIASRGEVRIWDATTWKEITTLRGHGERIETVAFDPALPRVVTGSRDRTARVWDAVTGAELFSLPHSATVFRVGFNRAGDRFFTTTIDGLARVWDARAGGWLATLEAGTASVNAAVFLANGELVTASNDRKIRFWDMARAGTKLLHGSSRVDHVQYATRGDALLTVGQDHVARVWTESGVSEMPNVAFAQLDPKQPERVATAAGTAVELRRGGARTHSFDATTPIDQLAYDGTRVAAASGTAVKIWDIGSGAMVQLPPHGKRTIRLELSAMGDRVMTAADDGSVRIASATSGEQIVIAPETPLVFATFSPRSDLVLTSSSTKPIVSVWDAATGKRRTLFRGHDEVVWMAKFDRSGNRIVSCSRDGTSRVYDVSTGNVVSVLAGHSSIVTSVGFDKTGRLAITGGNDKTVRIWDANRGRVLGTYPYHGDTITYFALRGDGATLASGSNNGTTAVWTFPELPDLSKLRALAKCVPFELSSDGRLLPSDKGC